MKDFASVLRALTRRIRDLQTTNLLPQRGPASPPAEDDIESTRSLYRGENAQWGVDQASELLRRLERRGVERRTASPEDGPASGRFPIAVRGHGIPTSGRRRPRRSLRERLNSRRLPSPRGLLN